MKKPYIALFDIDKTIYQGNIIFELAEYQCEKKLIEKKYIELLANERKRYHEGHLTYEEISYIILVHWAQGLKDVPYEIVVNNCFEFLSIHKERFFPYAKRVIKHLQANYDIFFLTNEPQFVGYCVADIFETKKFVSSEFEIRDNVFTGKVSRALSTSAERKRVTESVMKSYAKENSIGFGDSVGDIGMLSSVAYPICTNPSSGLLKKAQENDWTIATPETIEEIVRNKLSNN